MNDSEILPTVSVIKPVTRKRQKKNTPVSLFKTSNVFARNIDGIDYYIDANNQVFKHEDVLNNKLNPRVIANAQVNSAGIYTLTFLETTQMQIKL